MTRATLAATLTLALAGCSSGKRIAQANDALRLEREALRERVAALEGKNAELTSKLSELNARLESPVPEDVLAALPRVAKVELTRYCQIEETDDGPVAVVYFKTMDGRNRFTQAVGSVWISVDDIIIPSTPGDNVQIDPTLMELGTSKIEPAELRELYIEALGGPAYVARVPLSVSPGTISMFNATRATITFIDAVTGTTQHHSRYLRRRTQ